MYATIIQGIGWFFMMLTLLVMILFLISIVHAISRNSRDAVFLLRRILDQQADEILDRSQHEKEHGNGNKSI